MFQRNVLRGLVAKFKISQCSLKARGNNRMQITAPSLSSSAGPFGFLEIRDSSNESDDSSCSKYLSILMYYSKILVVFFLGTM